MIWRVNYGGRNHVVLCLNPSTTALCDLDGIGAARQLFLLDCTSSGRNLFGEQHYQLSCEPVWRTAFSYCLVQYRPIGFPVKLRQKQVAHPRHELVAFLG